VTRITPLNCSAHLPQRRQSQWPLGAASENRALTAPVISTIPLVVLFLAFVNGASLERGRASTKATGPAAGAVFVHRATLYDVSPSLASMRASGGVSMLLGCQAAECGSSPPLLSEAPDPEQQQTRDEPIPPPAPPPTLSPAGIAIEQTSQGARPAVLLLESFDGLGAGFEGPQGTTNFRSPSDDSLAVGPDHIVQIVNSRIAIYSKRGKKYEKSGNVLYGAVATKSLWTGFGGACEARNNGDAVVRYDQLAGRWLIVMPIFSRSGSRRAGPCGAACKDGPIVVPGCGCCASCESGSASSTATRAKTTGEERGRVGDVLRSQHRAGPARHLLSLRVRANVVSGLSETRNLDGRLLRANQYR